MRLLLFCGVAAMLCPASPGQSAGPPGVWLDVPYVRQEKNGCGSAAIAMVLEYWKKEKSAPVTARSDAREIQRALEPKGSKGISAKAMQRYFQDAGFRTFAFAGQWDDLKEHLQQGRPLIVSLRPRARSDNLHTVVVAGVDWEKGLVFLNDPAQRKLLATDRAEFEKEWKAAGRWTLLAVPAQVE